MKTSTRTMLVLGIESSCDECAAALMRGEDLLAQNVSSQIELHAPYGGVVPELASRDHVRKIVPVIKSVMEASGACLEDLDGIGVTVGPGLIGSLLVGVTAAKTLSWSLQKPIVGVNHLEAHLRAAFIDDHDLYYPHLGLVVSGGHTSLFRVNGVGDLVLLGRTLDDAAGEAFDKVAKLLGLSYPGGISIQRAAKGGDPNTIRFPRPMPGKRLDSSFSGLKTSAAVHIRKNGLPEGKALSDFTASFQEAVVDTLVRKTLLAARREKLDLVVVSGGVGANERLREKMNKKALADGVRVVFPPVEFCTDNAAMVAALAAVYLGRGTDHGLGLDANAGLGWQTL